jgi:hypothetical protein
MDNRGDTVGIYKIVLFVLICFNWLSIITLILALNDNDLTSYKSACITSIVPLGLSIPIILWQFWYLHGK